MDCKEFEKLIPDFIGDRLEPRQLKKFIGHADACAECREELTIQILVMEGMARLEDGAAFDLSKEVETRLEEARRSVMTYDTLKCIEITMKFFALAGLTAIVLLLLF